MTNNLVRTKQYVIIRLGELSKTNIWNYLTNALKFYHSELVVSMQLVMNCNVVLRCSRMSIDMHSIWDYIG